MSSMHGKSVHPKCGNTGKDEKGQDVICTSTRYSTVVSGKSYRCRSCGAVKQVAVIVPVVETVPEVVATEPVAVVP